MAAEAGFLSSITNFRAQRQKLPVERRCLGALGVLLASYVITFLQFAYARYDDLGSQGFDLAIFDQATWLISRGQTPFVTVRGLHILADHFSAILYVLAPLYWLWASPKMLLTVQVIALASGALPVYAFAYRRTASAPVAVVFASAYLFYPTLQWSSLCEFHPDTLAAPLLMGAFYCAEVKNWRSYFLLLTLAALTKETVGLTILLLGFYLLKHETRLGWGTVVFGAAALLGAMGTMRGFNHGQPSPYLWLYHDYGATAGAIAAQMLRHPVVTTAALNTRQNGDYLLQLLQPVAFLALLAPEVLALALPALMANLLSSRAWMHNIYGWYTPLITPFVFAAAIIGFTRCQRWKLPLVTRGLLLYLSFSIAVSLANGPFLLHPWPITHGLAPVQAAEARLLLRLVPSDASVSAPTVLLPHLSHRCAVYAFPNPFYPVSWGATVQALQQQDGEDYPRWTQEHYTQAANLAPVAWVVLCPQPIHSVPPDVYRQVVAALLRSPSYGLVAVGRGTLVLQRGADHTAGLRLLVARAGPHRVTNADVEAAYRDWFEAAWAEYEAEKEQSL